MGPTIHLDSLSHTAATPKVLSGTSAMILLLCGGLKGLMGLLPPILTRTGEAPCFVNDMLAIMVHM